MPPRGVKSPKRTRQYEHIKESAEERGASPKRAKEIAARTVNKQRREAGQTKDTKGAKGTKPRTSTASRKRSTGSRGSRKR